MGYLLNKVSSLGRDGLTHNMLNDIHNNWKNAEAVRIKCLGVPTVDMENVCTQLELVSDDTGHKLRYRPVSGGPYTNKPLDQYVPPVSSGTGRFQLHLVAVSFRHHVLADCNWRCKYEAYF
ncbi:hypothetical protein GW17_00011978 [Ensete ventricosum]|nr:hypothetical protein GW17_00011978 [Ensete ventricosum]